MCCRCAEWATSRAFSNRLVDVPLVPVSALPTVAPSDYNVNALDVVARLGVTVFARGYNITLPSCAREGATACTADKEYFQLYVYDNVAAARDGAYNVSCAVTEVQWCATPEIRVPNLDLPNYYGFPAFGRVVGRVRVAPRSLSATLFRNQMIGTRRTLEDIPFSRRLVEDEAMHDQWTRALAASLANEARDDGGLTASELPE